MTATNPNQLWSATALVAIRQAREEHVRELEQLRTTERETLLGQCQRLLATKPDPTIWTAEEHRLFERADEAQVFATANPSPAVMAQPTVGAESSERFMTEPIPF